MKQVLAMADEFWMLECKFLQHGSSWHISIVDFENRCMGHWSLREIMKMTRVLCFIHKVKGWRVFYYFNGWRQQVRGFRHERQAVSDFHHTTFGEEWFLVEGKWFHTMNDAWCGTVQKTSWPSRVIVRTRMASDMDDNRRSEMSWSDGPRERKMAEN